MIEIIEFVSIVFVALGILQVILFFKVWGMTNDVRKLTRTFCKDETNDSEAKGKMELPDVQAPEPKLTDINPGDRVVGLSDNKEMIVDSIRDGRAFCKASAFEGYKYYSAWEIKKQ